MNYSRMTYLADGAQTSFRYAFKVDQETDLRVFTVDPLDLEHLPLFLTTDYTVTGVGDDEGGTIELTLAGLTKATEGLKLVIKKGPAYECSGGGQPEDSGFDISFEEQWTGGYDRTDGNRKIYSKTIDCGDITAAGTYFTPLNIPDYRKIWVANGWAPTVNGGISSVFPLPQAGLAPIPITLLVDRTNQAVKLINNSTRTSIHAYVMVHYTKN